MATKKSTRVRRVQGQPATGEPPQSAAEVPVSGPRRPGRCVVCGDEVAPFSTEELCWVCRRLKISAWREADTQAAAQE
jgi:hypothetical protein